MISKLKFDFTALHIDLYILGSKIYFGDLTSACINAQDIFYPIAYDKYFTNQWKSHERLINNINYKDDKNVVTKSI